MSIMPKLANLASKISPKLCFSLQYYHHRHRFPNLSSPKDISEVIGSEIVSGKINNYFELVDKIKVRNHLENWGLGQYLPRVYAIWEAATDIDVSNMPEHFIIKTNHGSGGHVICKDKSKINLPQVKAHFQESLNKKYNASTEKQYSLITPLVYCEEFLDDGNEIPTDYKFMCLDGKIKCILVCFGRDKEVHKLVYNTQWQKMPYLYEKATIDYDYPLPHNFSKMKSIVEQIASQYTQVRVDLYNCFGKIYIGELTFTADGGILRNFTTEAIKLMGRQ